MNPRARFLAAGLAAVIPLLAAVSAKSHDPKGAPHSAETQVLIIHALATAIDGTTAHLTARSIATIDGRKPDQAKEAMDAMRTAARSSYKAAGDLFTEASKRLENAPGDDETGRLNKVANDYTRTMWQLAGKATPTTEEKQEAKPSGDLNIDELAALETINQTVRSSLEAFLVQQLAIRVNEPGNSAVVALRDHAGAMGKASKKTASSFPGIPEALLDEAEDKLDAAKHEKSAAKAEKKAAKAVGKTAKYLASRAGSEEAKEIKQAAKDTKKDAGEQEKKAKKAEHKAKKAKEKEIGGDVSPSIQTLARQGRELVLLIDKLMERSESADSKESKKNS